MSATSFLLSFFPLVFLLAATALPAAGLARALRGQSPLPADWPRWRLAVEVLAPLALFGGLWALGPALSQAGAYALAALHRNGSVADPGTWASACAILLVRVGELAWQLGVGAVPLLICLARIGEVRIARPLAVMWLVVLAWPAWAAGVVYASTSLSGVGDGPRRLAIMMALAAIIPATRLLAKAWPAPAPKRAPRPVIAPAPPVAAPAPFAFATPMPAPPVERATRHLLLPARTEVELPTPTAAMTMVEPDLPPTAP